MIEIYVKKPIPIRVIKWTGENYQEIKAFAGDRVDLGYYTGYGHTDEKSVTIHGIEGDEELSVGNYIVRGVKGEFYPIRADILDETYDKLTSDKLQTSKLEYVIGQKVIITFLKGKLVKPDRFYKLGGADSPHPIPKIKLLNGKVIYGSECWWTTEDDYKKAHGIPTDTK